MRDGEADAAVELHIPATMLQRKYDLVASPLMFNPTTFGFGTTKGANHDLLTAIDGYIRSGRPDPASHYNTTLDKWLGETLGTTTRWHVPGYVFWIVAVVALVAVLLIGVNVLLRHQVDRRTQALRDQRDMVNRIMETSPVGITYAAADGTITLANAKAAELLGVKREAVASSDGDATRWVFTDQNGRPIRTDELPVADVLQTSEPVDDVLVTAGSPDGEQSLLLASGVPIRGKHEEVAGVLAVFEDVTERVQTRIALQRSAEQLRAALHDTVKAMGDIVGLRDPYTANHEKRVTRLAEAIARQLGLNDDRREGLMIAGEVHDIGKIGMPAEILTKPARLSEAEYELVKQHPERGSELLSGIAFEWPVAEMVNQHHERLDGSGYPRGLSGDDIMLEARILAVADVVEAMATHRPYRPALGVDVALDEVRGGAGTRYDADVVAACEAVIAGGFVLDDGENEAAGGAAST